jgi:hypothetical protein
VKNRELMAIIAGGMIGNGLARMFDDRRKQKERRAKILREDAKQIKAVNKAAKAILNRMGEDPSYVRKGLWAIMDDFKFEEIVARYED